MRTAAAVLCVAACACAVQVGYPPAASYVYRSDNGAPPSLLQLGPQPFAGAYGLAPLPLPYVNAKPIAIEDAEEDDESGDDEDEGEGDAGSAYGHESGGGSDYGEEHHAAHGEKGSKGYATKAHHAKGAAGHYGKQHDQGYYHEGKGEKGAHHDAADAHGEHHAAGKSYEGGDHGHKKHFSKGEDVTGYHKVFHKDEYKKDHDFYDVAAKDGHFNKHGYEKAHHGSEKGAHEKGGHRDAGYDKGGFGKAGSYDKGSVDSADEGHSAEEGVDSHYSRGDEFSGEGGSERARQHGYQDADDE